MKKITAAFFSPTGGTERAARMLAECFDRETRWLDLMCPDQRTAALEGDELLLLALPVYAGQIPAVEGLLDGLTGRDTPCVLLAAYGNRHYDDALAQMKKKLNDRGFRCAGGAAVVTPHVFAPSLGMGRPNETDRAVLAGLARAVEDKLAAPAWEEAALPGNPEPAPRKAVPVQKERDWDICLGCGLCARVCPSGAMDRASLAWDDGKCISCMACVSRCPVGALGFHADELARRLTVNCMKPRDVECFV